MFIVIPITLTIVTLTQNVAYVVNISLFDSVLQYTLN